MVKDRAHYLGTHADSTVGLSLVKKIGLTIWAPILIQQHENKSGWNVESNTAALNQLRMSQYFIAK